MQEAISGMLAGLDPALLRISLDADAFKGPAGWNAGASSGGLGIEVRLPRNGAVARDCPDRRHTRPPPCRHSSR